MPGYKGHIAGGIVTGALAIGSAAVVHRFTDSPLQLSALMGFCLLGSLFPDSDTDSKGQNLFYAIFVLMDGFLIYRHAYKLAAWLGLFAMLPALGHHRGWTHSWPAMLLVGSPILIVPSVLLGTGNITLFIPFYLSFTLGYFSHLLLDRII
ncbi:metal-dependent hydrolase [Desulforhopalus singaporensis]|uniref:LexA-binding, inner membrane-associated putative hydrolase n=1 Tax=Desulforhopalus singaporensis TaxID=91360 RepID=A0A1H0LU24_9BACT|nr:metal-dependent hydrolase [Desulforhopalus singaporensis]SDO71667.1 LexA-binding, inner membrane-associated putative hydrolase [Desulforhopalus singaporensis]